MRDRSEQILRAACLALAALVLAFLVRAGCRAGALVGAKIPPVPVLETNSLSGTNSPTPPKGSNAPPAAIQATNASKPAVTGTNAAAGIITNAIPGGTNPVSARIPALGETNGLAADTNSSASAIAGTNITPDKVAAVVSTNPPAIATNLAGTVSPGAGTNEVAGGTNLVFNGITVPVETNGLPAAGTNSPAPAVAETNVSPAISTNLAGKVSLTAGTNAVAPGTNSISAKITPSGGTSGSLAAGSNLVDVAKSAKKSQTNLPPRTAMAGGMDSGGPPGMPGKAAKLPPDVQARVDKIVDSEIFAPVMHPLPMALLGIAGDSAFLRTASGQTGLVKEGDSLGDLKLLRIGINRVLVEQDGQKKELTIFNGYGGESLLESSK